jgi:hypothetical protein
VIVATQVSENYLESFHEFEERAAGHDLPWLRTLRSDAFDHFCEVGFPTTHDEDWRFTNERPSGLSQMAISGYRNVTWNRTGWPGLAINSFL